MHNRKRCGRTMQACHSVCFTIAYHAHQACFLFVFQYTTAIATKATRTIYLMLPATGPGSAMNCFTATVEARYPIKPKNAIPRESFTTVSVLL